MAKPVPYDEIDQNMVSLVRVLNSFDAIETVSCCGGHENVGPGQWEHGSFYLKFEIEQTRAGWLTLEGLAWAINEDYRKAHTVTLLPVAPPQSMNSIGEILSFVIEGYNSAKPEDLAQFLQDMLEIDEIVTDYSGK